jgi:uncharacterized integral membrane protein
MQVAWVLALVVAILVALFAVQNTTPVSVSFLFWSVNQAAVALVVVVSVAAGALITLLVGLPRLVRSRWRMRRLRSSLRQQEQRIAELEAELERLRGRPIVRELPSPPSSEARGPDRPSAALPGEQSAPR